MVRNSDGDSHKSYDFSVTENHDDDNDDKDASNGLAVPPSNANSKNLTLLALSFAKHCCFAKSGIGKLIQNYEGLASTGSATLMLESAMKLKGYPTMCDEDLFKVEQTHPNQLSRLLDELLLSSGWRRISKCYHFSLKSTPNSISFFHSKFRYHPKG